MEVSIDAAAVEALADRLGAGGAVFEREVELLLERLAYYAQAEGMRESPVVTGTLRRSWTTSVSPRERRVGPTVEYARWVAEGRGEVRPVNARVLTWALPGGQRVFAMRSGPSRPNPFVRIAAERTRARVPTEVDAFVAGVRRGLVG